MGIIQRLKNLYFWSSISSKDAIENPRSFAQIAANREEMGGTAYIIGMSEEEQSQMDSFKKTEDTKIA